MVVDFGPMNAVTVKAVVADRHKKRIIIIIYGKTIERSFWFWAVRCGLLFPPF